MGPDDTDYETLFRRFYPLVLSFFRRRGFAGESAADLTQDVFERVYRAWEGYRGDAERSWIVQIATNVWKNELRRQMAQKRDMHVVSLDSRPGDDDDRALEPRDREDDPETSILARERRRRLRDALTRLPPQARRCALLRYQQGLKYREIADLLELSVGTVKSHLAQAKERLRGELEGEPALSGRSGGER